jgi:hypothetical protein
MFFFWELGHKSKNWVELAQSNEAMGSIKAGIFLSSRITVNFE